MGNSHNKIIADRNAKQSAHSSREGQAYTSQFSLSHFVGNLSGRSFVSVTSSQSIYSASRPWSRVSRRRWNNATLNNPLEASKTAWPVAHKESIFLPDFPITTDLLKNDYAIKETISRGAFGEVCKVKKLSTDKEYALKVLNKAQIVSDNAVRQVKEEARIQEACGHHSFIVGAVSRWQTKKRLYIISEYIPGGELLALLQSYGALPEDLVRVFIAEIAIAIDFLHNAGVIYRDLKPENILLDADQHIKLIDFGLSKWLTVGARTTTLCGTLRYMAPEVLSKEPYGHAVDWWSLGVIACRMLTDQFPAALVVDKGSAADEERGDGNVGWLSSAMEYQKGLTSISDAMYINQASHPSPGSLPAVAEGLSRGARGLLMRLLERDPRARLRTLRQLEQTAFFFGFKIDDVREKKISPKSILDQHHPDGPHRSGPVGTEDMFATFDQMTVM